MGGAVTITTFTWGDVIDLITSAFDINQSRLAKMMLCDKSKITRIKRGMEIPSHGNEEIFANVFDPAKSENAAISGETLKYCLELLKETIESDFKGIFEAMSDCWGEKEYKKFVLILLRRARQGASSKRGQNEVSLSETPSEKMSKIFEQAVADFNIATYICRLPDYLNGDPYCAENAFDFIDAIKADILGQFVHQQDKDIFKQISEFTTALEAYSCFLGMIRLSVSEKYGSLLKLAGLDCEIIGLIDDERNEIKNKLGDKFSSKESTNAPSDSELEGRLTQLDFIRSILLSHKRLCELFEKICPGKTILVFQ